MIDAFHSFAMHNTLRVLILKRKDWKPTLFPQGGFQSLHLEKKQACHW